MAPCGALVCLHGHYSGSGDSMMRKATRAFEVERKSPSVVASWGLGALKLTVAHIERQSAKIP